MSALTAVVPDPAAARECPPSPGLLLLLRLRLALLRNRLRSLDAGGWAKVAVLGALLVAFLVGEGWLVHGLLASLRDKEDLAGDFVGLLIARLLSLAFLVSLSMLFFSNVTASLATLYLSRDLDLLLATPIPAGRVFALKLIETVINSSYMIILFMMPILVALGLVFDAPWPFYLHAPPLLVAFVLPPAGAGILLTVLLLRYLPARRTHQMLTAVGVLLAVSLVTGLRLLAPERLLRAITTADLEKVVRGLTVPASAWLPSTWVADAELAAARGEWQTTAVRAAWLMALAAAAMAVTYAVARVAYFRGVASAHEAGQRRRRARPEMLARPLSAIAKDARVFLRDPTQWSQTILLLALVVVYVFNMTALPQDLLILRQILAVRHIIAWMNVGLAGFVLAAIAMRFVLPAISIEGGAFWIVAASPARRRDYVLRKLAFYLPAMLLFVLALVLLSGMALGVDTETHLISLGLAALETAALTSMAVGMGAALPSFKLENPAQFVLTGGGLLYGVSSLVLVVAVTALHARPFFWRILVGAGILPAGSVDPWPYYAAILALTLLAAVGPLLWGLKRIEELEM